jgi:hypothetical protein
MRAAIIAMVPNEWDCGGRSRSAKRNSKIFFAKARGRHLSSTDVPRYHAANDAIAALEVSQLALGGSLMIVISSPLSRFKDGLDATWADWDAGNPRHAGCSAGQISPPRG